MIKAILFDYDGTLSNRLESAYKKYTDVVLKLFPNLDPYEIEGIVQRMMTWDEYGTINKRHVYEMLNKYYKLDLDVEYWVSEWYSNFHEFQVLQDDCLEILSKLKDNYLVGCITNGPIKTQALKLDFTHVTDYFDICLISEEVGITKPDPKIFELAASKLGLRTDEIMFVGDNFYADCLGAKRAGMHPVWFFTDTKRSCIKDVPRIYSLSDLFSLLENYK